jgi:hypothetical protein
MPHTAKFEAAKVVNFAPPDTGSGTVLHGFWP